VLVAEDEATVRELFARVLAQEGAEVVQAQDGAEAWERLVGDRFDLVIADVRMPNVDGQQLYERVAAERPDLMRRFVFATGDLARPDTLSFLSGLPNRILTKPLEIETVRRVLSQALVAAA
jgi:CheY-like chemotaxis protein